MITGKGTPRAIRPVHAWRKPYDQETRVNRAKWRHRPTVVIRIATVNVVQKVRKSRASAALPLKNSWVHRSLLHVAYDRPAEASCANKARTRHEFFELLLHFFLVVRFCLALRRANRGA